MVYKEEVIKRLQGLQQEASLSTQEFKKILTEITGKTPRTVRRWYSFATAIRDIDLNKIALHFGHHENWLRFGDKSNQDSMMDQIMTSNHFGVVVMKDGDAEAMNHKFIEMMKLTQNQFNEAQACHDILSYQSEETVGLCNISSQIAEQTGSHHHTMVMILGDKKPHTVDVTSLNINHGRVMRVLVDKGLVESH